MKKWLFVPVIAVAACMAVSCASQGSRDAASNASKESAVADKNGATSEAGSQQGSSDAASESGVSKENTDAEQAEVLLGDEQFEEYLPLLEGKRVALFSNHTGIVGDEVIGSGDRSVETHFGVDEDGKAIQYGEHILDALVERKVNVVAVFSPEHGFRGTEDAGATIVNSVDEKTGVPLLSLYENEDTHAPAKADMDKFDVLVVDMQDVGLRYYTYYLSMYYLMDACAAEKKDVIILDRPNPNGFYVDGPILQEKYKSNVGQLPIPVVYGMTWGELAGMINGEGWLSSGKNSCNLTVIPCKNYTHQTKTSLIRNPSPNIKNMRAVYLYSSTCFFENTVMSVGRGTEFPFEVYGSPFLKGLEGLDFSFTPKSMSGALEPPFMDETCYGVDLRTLPVDEIWKNGVNPDYLVTAYNAYKKTGNENYFWGKPYGQDIYWIDYLSGSDSLRKMIEAGKTSEEIKASWQEEIQSFREQRKPYLLYEDQTTGSLPKYEYPGPELYYSVLYKFMTDHLAEVPSDREVSIPCPVIIAEDESDKNDIKVYGDFWTFNYYLDGKTMKSSSGGSYPGCIHVKYTADGYEVTGMDRVEDGSQYVPTAKKIFGKHYDEFMKFSRDEKGRETLRAQIIANYAAANKLDITAYQGTGWEPVPLPEENIDSFYSVLN